tara:strand:+ start:3149 stop:3739 length:591 start_codon:yes stop_codon:yes gene_type:complete
MIGSVKGIVRLKEPPVVMLNCKGIGYEIEVSTSLFHNLPDIGSSLELFTHLQITENSHTLYGFENLRDRSLFRSLLKINGVGAKLALSILSVMSVEEFHANIKNEDSSALMRISGVGKKTAERLVIEMRDKFDNFEGEILTEKDSSKKEDSKKEAFDALLSLGYKASDVNKIMSKLKTADKKTDEIIRMALKKVNN